jgi:cyclase
MKRPRIIPVLLLDGRRAVKSIQFANPKYVGDPINTTRIFSQKCADELIVLDSTVRENKSSLDFGLISRIAEEAFMPLAYGGGISSLVEADKLFEFGIEKIVVGWKDEKTTKIIDVIANKYGSQAVSVCLDVTEDKRIAKRCRKRSRPVFDHEDIPKTLVSIGEAGAGELILQSVDRDGLMRGMDLSTINFVSTRIKIPLVALGGAGSLSDLADAIHAGASAVAAASCFVFRDENRTVLINYPNDELVGEVFKIRGNS